jgi:hypothetical protein
VGLAGDLASRAAFVHESTLALADRVDDATMRRRAGPTSPSIAFHLWHMARWADRMQAHVPTMSPGVRQRIGEAREIWARDGLAAKWGMPAELGSEDTGMSLSDEQSEALPLPAKAELLAYVRPVFAAADRVFAATHDEDLAARAAWLYGGVQSVMLSLIQHEGHMQRHLGMIEALIGVAGQRGTATR